MSLFIEILNLKNNERRNYQWLFSHLKALTCAMVPSIGNQSILAMKKWQVKFDNACQPGNSG
jgi:hypothetical protein